MARTALGRTAPAATNPAAEKRQAIATRRRACAAPMRRPRRSVATLESGYNLEIPRMFVALALLSAAGVLLWAVLSGLSWLLLHRWHEIAVRREG